MFVLTKRILRVTINRVIYNAKVGIEVILTENWIVCFFN